MLHRFLLGLLVNEAATSGTITLVEFNQACGGKVSGSFEVRFDTQKLTGAFDTLRCNHIKSI